MLEADFEEARKLKSNGTYSDSETKVRRDDSSELVHPQLGGPVLLSDGRPVSVANPFVLSRFIIKFINDYP